ncbi:hypothetical protein HY734_01795 [Candidatus Uhrbacteria bacterium]|nr:hypothetical protein [Candidatus Uhrbacteria bacterium]
MESRLTSFIGRFLIIPIALSGVCLSMLFGIPMAGAMKMDQLSINTAIPYDHEMVVRESQDHGTQAGCCTGVRMEHDTEATTPDHPNAFVGFFVADLTRALLHNSRLQTA